MDPFDHIRRRTGPQMDLGDGKLATAMRWTFVVLSALAMAVAASVLVYAVIQEGGQVFVDTPWVWSSVGVFALAAVGFVSFLSDAIRHRREGAHADPDDHPEEATPAPDAVDDEPLAPSTAALAGAGSSLIWMPLMLAYIGVWPWFAAALAAAVGGLMFFGAWTRIPTGLPGATPSLDILHSVMRPAMRQPAGIAALVGTMVLLVGGTALADDSLSIGKGADGASTVGAEASCVEADRHIAWDHKNATVAGQDGVDRLLNGDARREGATHPMHAEANAFTLTADWEGSPGALQITFLHPDGSGGGGGELRRDNALRERWPPGDVVVEVDAPDEDVEVHFVFEDRHVTTCS